MKYLLIVLCVTGLMFSACQTAEIKNSTNLSEKISKKSFGKLKTGQVIDLYTLENKNGLKTEIINYGAIQVSLLVPDKNGNFDD